MIRFRFPDSQKSISSVLEIDKMTLLYLLILQENITKLFKVGISPSKKNRVICLIESPLKMMKNDFYFILKALFVLKLFRFLSRLFGRVGKTA